MSSNHGKWKNSDLRALTLGESHHFISTNMHSYGVQIGINGFLATVLA